MIKGGKVKDHAVVNIQLFFLSKSSLLKKKIAAIAEPL
jgi:hypothetical protein